MSDGQRRCWCRRPIRDPREDFCAEHDNRGDPMAARNPDAVRAKAEAQVERLTKDVERYTKHVDRDADSLERSRRKLADAQAELQYARQHPALKDSDEETPEDREWVDSQAGEDVVDDIPGQTILPPVATR